MLSQALQLQQAGKLAEAAAVYRELLRCNPRDAEALGLLGTTMARTNPHEACHLIESAVRLKPHSACHRSNLGAVLRRLGRQREAITELQEAINLGLNHLPEVHLNLGHCHRDLRELDQAIACYRRARDLKHDPEQVAARSLAMALLLAGRYEEGWAEYRFRRSSRECQQLLTTSPAPYWEGQDLRDKTILVHGEQGHGDFFQFARYVPELRWKGCRVVLQVYDHLRHIASPELVGTGKIIQLGDRVPPVDYQVLLMDLPGMLGVGKLPTRVPYLTIPEWAPSHHIALPGHKIGLAWQGNPEHPHDHHRSMPLRAFARVHAAGHRLVSLQIGYGAEQMNDCGFSILDTSCRNQDWCDTARVMAQCDLILSIDSAVAHLAGALGLPVWVLLPYEPDWRWGLEGDTTEWYPSMRLFRQREQEKGDWGPVISRVLEALR